MATSPLTPTARRITITPGSRILDVSLTPSTNGRLRDSTLDEDSIRRRDKASLIAYIATLEAQIYDLQHNLGLLIMEKKDSASKYDEAILTAEKAEAKHLREKAALSSAIAEARKREDDVKKALGVEKECVANIEKALHELRAECAEVKVSAEIKMSEARSMVEDAQYKYTEAEVKLRTAESLQDDARRSERAAGRQLQEIESREDDLRRRLSAFKSDCEAKEAELMLERQSLLERQRVLGESQNKLLDSQALLNQREADILSKSQALKRLDIELGDKKVKVEAEIRALTEQKANLELNAFSLSEREKAVVEKEVLLSKKEQELLISQETFATKEHNEVQKVLAEQEIVLKSRRDEFDAELLLKQKVVEEDIERKRREWELREFDLKQREDLILEKEQDFEVQSRVITDKGNDLAEKMKNVQEREYHLSKSESEIELTQSLLQKEREEINQAKVALESSLVSMEVEKKNFSEERMRLELMKSESSELLVLESKLKEEIDMIRAQKQQLDEEAEKLMVEKAKFETEWELIDVKREELRQEEERIAGERDLISSFLKDGRDSLNLEKDALREQYKRDLESLAHDREAFMSESQRDRSDWFAKFQKERADFLLEMECRKRELEDCINKRHEDVESYFKEKEGTFEEEKKRDVQYIASLKDNLAKDQERVAAALKKLETEKLEIKMDREERDKAWAELQNLIEELQMQRVKLKEQREMLHADREEIHSQIEQLKDLEDVKVDSPRMQKSFIESTPQVIMQAPTVELAHKLSSAEDRENTEDDSTPSSTVSWLKRCTSLIFKHPSDDSKHFESSLDSAHEGAKLGSVEQELLRIDEKLRTQQGVKIVAVGNSSFPGKSSSEEPKVIHEVPLIDEEAAPSEARKDVHESSVSSPITTGTRKRRIDSSSAPETDAELQNNAMSNKKRRQEGDEAHDDRLNLNQTRNDGQHVVSSSSQSKERVVNSVSEVERRTIITSESRSQFQHNEGDQSVFIKNEALTTSVITKQIVIEEVHLLNGGDANNLTEKAPQNEAGSELLQQDEDPPEAKADLPEAVKQRGKRKSKRKA